MPAPAYMQALGVNVYSRGSGRLDILAREVRLSLAMVVEHQARAARYRVAFQQTKLKNVIARWCLWCVQSSKNAPHLPVAVPGTYHILLLWSHITVLVFDI